MISTHYLRIIFVEKSAGSRRVETLQTLAPDEIQTKAHVGGHFLFILLLNRRLERRVLSQEEHRVAQCECVGKVSEIREDIKNKLFSYRPSFKNEQTQSDHHHVPTERPPPPPRPRQRRRPFPARRRGCRGSRPTTCPPRTWSRRGSSAPATGSPS